VPRQNVFLSFRGLRLFFISSPDFTFADYFLFFFFAERRHFFSFIEFSSLLSPFSIISHQMSIILLRHFIASSFTLLLRRYFHHLFSSFFFYSELAIFSFSVSLSHISVFFADPSSFATGFVSDCFRFLSPASVSSHTLSLRRLQLRWKAPVALKGCC